MADRASHRPVAGAVTIYVRHPDNFVSSTVQSDDGTFRFDDLPPGSALLVAQADGFAPYAGSLSVAAGNRATRGCVCFCKRVRPDVYWMAEGRWKAPGFRSAVPKR